MPDILAASPSAPSRGPDIAVLVPCHNEAAAIAKVVGDFSAALPSARIWAHGREAAGFLFGRSFDDLLSRCRALFGGHVKPIKAERPALFFSIGLTVCAVTLLVLAVPLELTYLQAGLLVPRFPIAAIFVSR